MPTREFSLIIVEDEPVICILIEDIAVDLGWTVKGCAYSEPEALALLGRSSPDVALVDLNLGSGNSLDVALACRSRGVPVVFVTGDAEAGILQTFGPAPILSKPFTTDDLARALSRALKGRDGNGVIVMVAGPASNTSRAP